MLISKNLKIEDIIDKDFIYINEHEFFAKVRGARFDVHNTFDLSYQPLISYVDVDKIQENINVILFPIIPQYFHNFFEMFTKIIKLKKYGERFKVVLVFDSNYHKLDPYIANEKTNNVFNFLIRSLNWTGVNSAHIKEFLDYINVEYICLTVEELKSFAPEYCYLFFDDGEYQQEDPFIFTNNKKYNLCNFLKVPNLHITLNDIDNLRYILPTSFVSKENKIFISRKKTVFRKYKYEEELENLAISLGYQIIFLEDLDFLTQIKLLQTSSHIVCPYGSALVNGCLLGPENNVLAINYTQGYRVKLYEDFFNKYNVPYTEVNINDNFDPTEYLLKVIKDWENKICLPKK